MGHGTQERTLAPTLPSEAEAILAKETSLVLASRTQTPKRRTEMTANLTVCASQVLSTQDLKVRPERDVTEIVGHFLSAAEAVVAHWVEYSKGLLLFVMVPGDARSGEFYVYDRKKGTFWLLSLADSVFGGYSVADMRQKIKDFRLLDFAEDPSRLRAAKG